MPNINFDATDSYYKFKCIFGVAMMIAPLVIIYFILKNDGSSVYNTIISLKDNCGVFIIIFFIFFIFFCIGMKILISGMKGWKVQQELLDKKLKKEVDALESASVKEINDKNKYKTMNNTIKRNNIIEHDTVKELDNKMIEFCMYLQKTIGNKYDIYSNAKINNSIYNRFDSYVFDCVAEAKNNKEDNIIYEIRFSYGGLDKVTFKLKRLLYAYTNKFHRDCRGEIAIIIDSSKNKMNVPNIPDKLKIFMNESNITMKTYEYNDIKNMNEK